MRLPAITRFAAALFSGAAIFCAPAVAADAGFAPIELSAKPIAGFLRGSPETKFGALEFRGGLDVDSTNVDFGSLSGLDFGPDGSTIYAVGDNGFWFTARLVEEGGRLVGVDSGKMAPILDSKGMPVVGKHLGDAEGLRLIERDGRLAALVTFERVNNLRRYIAAPELADSRSEVLKLPAFVGGLRRNQGLETVAVAPAEGPLAGATVLVSEHSIDKAGNYLAFVLSGPNAGAFAIRREGDYDITDGAFLPDGDLLILERKFSFTEGFAMRLRRIATDSIRPGKTVDGTVLLEADMRHQIDNMEGLAVRAGENGETLIAIVSDDNHNLLQRTLLFLFALPAPPAAAAAAGSPRL